MPVQLNHTIIAAADRQETAEFLADILGLPAPAPFGPFLVVQCANDVSLDVITASGPIPPQHYAFLVSEDEFDEIYGRITERRLDHWADPHHSDPGRINNHDGGRGVYWSDPNGHNLEIITVPYGGG